jgi:hypothetical protein
MDHKLWNEVVRAAQERGLGVVDCGNGHLQIVGGPLLVSYYPESKRKTAYVAGTTGSKIMVTPKQAVNMALKAPELGPGDRKDTRKASGTTRGRRNIVSRLRARDGDGCVWCGGEMLFYRDGPSRATIEHVIPLGRGGLDNMNNMRLAHRKCNNERGSDMPELEENSGKKEGDSVSN